MATTHFVIIALLFLSLTSLAFSKRCHRDDKKALLQIKKDLNNPDNLFSWDLKTDCSDWLFVECHKKSNRVTIFDFFFSDYNLPIPTAIVDLPCLQSLSFQRTNFTGQVPQAIAKLSMLRSLDLRSNHLPGPIPSFLMQLKKLTYIDLSSNSFTGSIPPSLSQLSKLGSLLLGHNQLTGSIPESFGDFRVRDFSLQLSHNQLTGPIPSSLGKASFYYLDIAGNMLEGNISFFFEKKKILHAADFSMNLFQFNMSKIKSFPRNLRDLDLHYNMIFGSLPKSLTKVDFASLNVSYNILCGEIPIDGSLQQMDYTAYFRNRCLCGAPLPPCK